MKKVKTITLTPLKSDGSITTLMATGYENKDWRYAISTGHYPAPMVLEVWQTDDGEQVPTDDINNDFVKYIRCGRLDGKKICNAARPKILQAVKELQANQFLRMRRLTPEEFLKFMGVSSEDVQKMQTVNTDKELYRQGGNSIVVPTIYEIFKSLLISKNK